MIVELFVQFFDSGATSRSAPQPVTVCRSIWHDAGWHPDAGWGGRTGTAFDDMHVDGSNTRADCIPARWSSANESDALKLCNKWGGIAYDQAALEYKRSKVRYWPISPHSIIKEQHAVISCRVIDEELIG